MTAAERWAAELAAWTISPDILAAAPESPYAFPVALFRAGEQVNADTSSRRQALAALPPAGSVLDVGCGGGAASLALVPPAAALVGVDESAAMLAAYAESAGERGVAHRTVEGRWPEVADRVEQCDVVVCHHVAYNVAALVPFVRALSAAARFRVVLELTQTHPWTPIGPLWRHFHGQDRPSGPSAELALATITEAGLPARMEYGERTAAGRLSRDELVTFTRRRLCLPVEREPEVAALVEDHDGAIPPRRVATIWWDVTSRVG